mgnify:CR=1 FL=1
MLWSHTAFETFEWCPRWFKHQYVLRDIPRKQTEEALRGDLAHQLAEKFIHWRMALKRPATKDEVMAWLDGQVGDVEERDGDVTSIHLDAAWLVENALPAFKRVFTLLDQADEWGTETTHYYDANFDPVQKPDVQYEFETPDFFIRKADLWARVGRKLYFWDWKTGKRFPKWQQLKLYGMLALSNHPTVQEVEGRFVWMALGGAEDVDSWASGPLHLEMGQTLASRIAQVRREKLFEETPGKPNCDWCPVKDCAKRLK